VSYSVEILCECGNVLDSDIEPGDRVTVPECDWCEKNKVQFEWPDRHTLLAVYGAPYNWPVAA
jgi:hypothetical protein